MSKQPQRLYEFGPFRLDTGERQLWRAGERVSLTPKVFETLVVLVERSGQLVEKDELMRSLWPDSFVEEANLNNNVYTLRKALGQDQLYIETVPKHGYRFVAEVRTLPDTVSQDLLVIEKRTRTHTVTEEEVSVGDEDAEAVPLLASKSLTNSDAERRRTGRALPLAFPLVIVALFVIGAATAFGIYWLISQRQPEDRARGAVPFGEMEMSRLTTSGKITHAAISRDGKLIAYVTVDAEGDSLWVRHIAAPTGVRVAGPAATEYGWVTFAPDGDSVYYMALDRNKGEAALYRVPVLGGPSSVVADDVSPVGFSPDARQMAFVKSERDAESRLVVVSADGTNERTLAVRRKPEFFRETWNAPAWSPDGKTIACQARLSDERGQYETIIGVTVVDGSQRPLTDKRWNYAGQPAWLADGSGLLVTADESATTPVQVWHISLGSGEATRVTNDLNNYSDISLTRDASRLAMVQAHTVSSIWVAPEGDASRAKQVASEVGWIQEVAWTPDGRLVYRSNAGGSADIWVMNADGSNPKQLTTGAGVSRGLSVSPDGHYIFFASDRAGRFNIWRVDADGSNLKQLTDGDDEFHPQATPDGQWVVYQRGVLEPRLWRVPADGGEAVQLTETRAVRPAVSPDGALIAYHYLDPDADKSRWRIGVVSSAGGARLQQFDFPPTVAPVQRLVRWSPDRQSIAYANSPSGLSDIWAQPLDGREPKRLTDFKAEQIIAFDWSRDGRSLVFVRGAETRDVVLIEQRQK